MKLDVYRIKIIMAEKRLNKTSLASNAEMTRNGVTYVLKKGTAEPATVGKLAAALGVPVEEIVLPEEG